MNDVTKNEILNKKLMHRAVARWERVLSDLNKLERTAIAVSGAVSEGGVIVDSIALTLGECSELVHLLRSYTVGMAMSDATYDQPDKVEGRLTLPPSLGGETYIIHTV